MERKLYTKGWFWLCIAIVVFLANQLPFLRDMRPVMYDEAWYADTAYNLLQGHGLRNAIVGTRGNSNFLLPMLTAGVMAVFGCNLFSIRLTAVLCGVLTMVFLSFCMKQMHVGWKSQSFTFLLFVSLSVFNTIFRFGRPECAAIMCVTGGIWLYLRYRTDASWKNMIGMSVFVFLAGCAHPYALLLFALLGILLLAEGLRDKNKKGLVNLIPLLLSAIVSVLAVAWVSKTYNVAGESYIKDRLSFKLIGEALPMYFKEAFLSKTTLSFLPLLAVILIMSFKNKENRGLAWVALAYFLVFPFLFSADLMMLGLGIDYVALVGVVLAAPFLEQSLANRGKWMSPVFVIYCLGCLGLTYYYNYAVKYEKANTVLAKELPAVVPDGSKVFGPIRQWPMLMKTNYQSEHTVLPIEAVESYDYVILNSQDVELYPSYACFLPIDDDKMELMYERNTRQYGIIKVYKTKTKK